MTKFDGGGKVSKNAKCDVICEWAQMAFHVYFFLIANIFRCCATQRPFYKPCRAVPCRAEPCKIDWRGATLIKSICHLVRHGSTESNRTARAAELGQPRTTFKTNSRAAPRKKRRHDLGLLPSASSGIIKEQIIVLVM